MPGFIRLFVAFLFFITPLHAFGDSTRSAVIADLEQKVASKSYKELGILIRKNLHKKFTINDLEKLAREKDCPILLYAIRGIRTLTTNEIDLKIDPKDLFEGAFFILTELPSHLPHTTYFSKEEFNLKYAVEHDSATGNNFIILDSNRKSKLGTGAKKKVHQTVLFDIHNPKILARAEQAFPMENELAIYKQIQGSQGIVGIHGFTSHILDSTTYTTLYLDLYNNGALRKFIKKKFPFTVAEVGEIICQLLSGLRSLHTKNIVHLDLHGGNCLVSIQDEFMPKRKITVVLADFGRARRLDQAIGIPAQGARYVRSPESWLYPTMKGEEYFASDIYALGCVFYQLVHAIRETPWQLPYLKDKTISSEEKKATLMQALDAECKIRFQHLRVMEEQGQLSHKEALELLTLTMVQSDPKMRKTARSLLHEAVVIRQRYSE